MAIDQIKALIGSKNEIKANVEKAVLLDVEKAFVPAEYLRLSFSLLEPNPKLLQENIRFKEKSINTKIEIIACYLST